MNLASRTGNLGNSYRTHEKCWVDCKRIFLRGLSHTVVLKTLVIVRILIRFENKSDLFFILDFFLCLHHRLEGNQLHIVWNVNCSHIHIDCYNIDANVYMLSSVQNAKVNFLASNQHGDFAIY